MTLGSRLAAAAGLVLVVLVAVGVLVPRAVRASQVDQVDHQLLGAVPVVIAIGSRAGPPAFIPNGSAPSPLSDLYLARVDTASRIVKVAPSSTSGRAPRIPTGNHSSAATGPTVATVGSESGSGSWRAALISLPDGSKWLLAIPLDRVDATLHRLIVAVLVAGAAIVAVMAAAGWWLVHLGLRPIAEVTDVADAITNGDRSRRVSQQQPGTEANHLARAINLMLDEQHSSDERLRQFVADASHELRTPVTAISGFADLWRQGSLAGPDVDDMMRRIGQESGRMRVLVEDLLLLARLDDHKPPIRVPVDLSQLVEEVRVACSATHPSRPVHVDPDGPVIVEGDRAQLVQVIRNLVDNALLHAGSSAQVTVTTRAREQMALITVADDGEGMTAADAERAFDRFWRADASRARQGSGLGLSIARGIVEAHGGRVVIDSRPSVGTAVRVVIPMPPDMAGPLDSQQTCNSPEANPDQQP